MKHVRKLLKNRLVNAFLVMVFLNIGCAKDQVASDAVKKSISISSVDLFKGVYFAEGVVADQVPELKSIQSNIAASTSSLDQNKLNDVKRDIIDEIATVHGPRYFDDFKATVQSGDVAAINDALVDGSAKVYEAIMSITSQISGASQDELAAAGFMDIAKNIDANSSAYIKADGSLDENALQADLDQLGLEDEIEMLAGVWLAFAVVGVVAAVTVFVAVVNYVVEFEDAEEPYAATIQTEVLSNSIATNLSPSLAAD